jgi:hypothetical protein
VSIPTLCSRCAAVVLLPARGVIEFAGSRLYRCPSCRSIVFHAIDDNPAPATERPTEPPASSAGRP